FSERHERLTMNPTGLLLATFVLSLVGLFAFIWSLRRGLFAEEASGARTIFSSGEVGLPEEPAGDARQHRELQSLANAANSAMPRQVSAEELRARQAADRSSAFPAFVLIACAVVWLVVASAAGLLASVKLHMPDLLTDQAWLSFGRVRTLHLNAVAYGWAPLGLLGIAIWINTGMEWLEIPWQVGLLFAVGGMLIGLPMAFMLQRRQVHHLYVSVWYTGAALFWFPTLYIVAKLPGIHFGVEQATMNWWFGHNVLGLFYTPLSLASIYYFLPKVIGRPVRSYNLSLLGFWTLAFFYGQVGAHHLIGGPVPEWLITLSIVQSVMMIIPVVAFSLNQHLTLKGHFGALRHSPTLRFICFGAVMYTFASVQGSFEALRSVNA